MMSDAPHPSGRFDPAPAWTVVTDAPLVGLSFARETGTLLAWDIGGLLYLIDAQGQRHATLQAEGKIIGATISDDGQLVAVLIAGPRLCLHGRDLEPLADRAALADPLALAVDPHGRYVAVSSRGSGLAFYTRHGRQAGKFDTHQPLAHIRFIADQPLMLGAAAFGMISGFDLEPSSSGGGLELDEIWRQQPMSNIGRLTTTGDGGMVLASCFTHGVQRYDARGHAEGSYHLGGTASFAVPDFTGRTIAVATSEGELAILNRGGNVRWKMPLSRPAVGLEVDALGRYLIYGLGTGEISRVDLDGTTRPAATAREAPTAAARAGSVRPPDWTAPVANSDEQAESSVLAVLDDPPRIAVMTNRNRLQLFTTSGGALGQAPEILGVGRILRTAPGWIAGATDRMVVLYDARRNGAFRLDLSLVELTHLAIRPDDYGVALVQERDRIGRATLAGRWVWKKELKTPLEDLAIGPDALTAVSTDDGRILVYDPAGEPVGSYQTEPAEPLCLVEAPEGSPPGVAWISLARRYQVVRGHRADGRPVWESPVPWEAWQLHRVGPAVVALAPDGRAVAFDGTGHPRGQSRASDPGAFFPGPDDRVWRVIRQGVHLICSDLSGRVHWRTVADDALGPLAAARTGVAVLIGRSLAWFGRPEAGTSPKR